MTSDQYIRTLSNQKLGQLVSV